MYLFKLPEKMEEVFVENPDLKYHEHFEKLTNREMVFVMLVGDYMSPVNMKARAEADMSNPDELEVNILTEAVRWCKYLNKDGTINRTGRKMIAKYVDYVDKAVRYYKNLCRWNDLEALDKIRAKLDEFIDRDDDPDEKYMRALKVVRTELVECVRSKIEIEELLLERSARLGLDRVPLDEEDDEEDDPISEDDVVDVPEEVMDDFEEWNPDDD